MKELVACKTKDVTEIAGDQTRERLFLSGHGSYDVERDVAAAVTPNGSMVYFVQYLTAGGLLDGLCASIPLNYTSPNAPQRRAVVATILAAILNGQTRYGMTGLWRLIDGLPPHCRPRLVRGDVSYGNEKIMVDAECRAQPYLFKLRQTHKVRSQIEQWSACPASGAIWRMAGRTPKHG